MSAAVSITAVIVLVSEFGLTGAGLASLVTGRAYTAGIAIAYLRVRRHGVAHGEDETAPQLQPSDVAAAETPALRNSTGGE